MKKQDHKDLDKIIVDASSDLDAASSYNSLNLARYMILPGKKVYCIVIRGPFKQTAPKELIKLTENEKIIILSGVFALDESDPQIANILAFIDFTNSQVKPEELAKRFQQFGLDIKMYPQNSFGFVWDNFFFPLKVGNTRVILFRKPFYEALFSGIRKEFGSAGEVFLYYMGLESGSRVFEDYKDNIGSIDPKVMIETACAFSFNMGWGIFKLLELNIKKKIIKIRIYDNFECAAGKGAGKPYSHFLRGVAAGLFMHFFKMPGAIEETKCIAQGDSFCEFIAKPAKRSGKIMNTHV